MRKPSSAWGCVLVALTSLGVYWRTAYPVITWWDSASYSLAAKTMAVVGPPGSLILTLVGWPIAQIAPDTEVAYGLNLFAGVLASLAIVLVYAVSLRILTMLGSDTGLAPQLGAGVGALALAFSLTTWDYAVQFTPYILTTVCTGLIVWRMLCWWEAADRPDAWKHFAALGLLIGLDFSVHRTNALLVLSVLAWVLVRNAKALRDWRVWAAGASTMLAALLLQLLLIPIARYTHSPLNWNDTSSLQMLWSFISLDRLGGGFLVDVWPRNAPFWSAQVGDVWRTFAQNFFHWNGASGILSVGAALMGVTGIVAMWRRDKRFGAAFVLLLVLHAAMTVWYFNIPESYFRSLNRHYLPLCITFGIAVAVGASTVVSGGIDVLRASASMPRRAIGAAGILVVLLLPATQLMDNWRARDASARHFAADYARNALSELPPSAIYFTVGDNDTFPILYLQAVEGIRRDVQLVNLSLLVDPAYAQRLVHMDSTLPIPTTRTLRDAAKPDWTDSTLADVVRLNANRRPITFAITARGNLGAFTPFARLEGLYYRAMQKSNVPFPVDSLRANLFRHEYRGFSDVSTVLDDASQRMASAYYSAFDVLLTADSAARSAMCRRDRAEIVRLLPPDRFNPGPGWRENLEKKCS